MAWYNHASIREDLFLLTRPDFPGQDTARDSIRLNSRQRITSFRFFEKKIHSFRLGRILPVWITPSLIYLIWNSIGIWQWIEIDAVDMIFHSKILLSSSLKRNSPPADQAKVRKKEMFARSRRIAGWAPLCCLIETTSQPTDHSSSCTTFVLYRLSFVDDPRVAHYHPFGQEEEWRGGLNISINHWHSIESILGLVW